ncbi:helix-turn-helix transcriptional regulator [Glycomyces sp. NPDC047010]|uniref:helix-turn-helix domain-containing protein n=1 Tax=Glycomyces sp. NPDC047010 TaxID=3155023 RepID=UPI0033CB8650
MAGENFLQRDLGRTLMKYRKRKGLTKEQAVWFLGTSKTTLDSYESGKLQNPEPGIVADWLGQYGATQEIIDDARAKAKWIRQGNPASWLEQAPTGFSQFIGIELIAEMIRIYEDGHVPGPFQTSAYADAVLATNPNLILEQRRDAVGFRIQRGESLFSRPGGPPQIQAVIPERALTVFRGTDIYEEQVEHLLDRNRLEGVNIFIVPGDTTYASRGWTYQIMTFADPKDPAVVYQENLFGGHYEADKVKVEMCNTLFSATLPVALGLEEWRETSADR